MAERSEQELRRLEELEQLQEKGIEAYPYEWDVNIHSSDVLEQFDDATHQPGDDGPTESALRGSLAGRIVSKRVMGKAAFFHLRDSHGDIQVYVRRDDLDNHIQRLDDNIRDMRHEFRDSHKQVIEAIRSSKD